MLTRTRDVLGDYDFSRSDRLFVLTVPSFKMEDGVAYYEFNLKDLIHNETYTSHFRYNQLKNIHDILTKLNVRDLLLPPFPVTHFWVKTNNNPKLMEKRRAGLEFYFSSIVDDPFLRGHREVKRIITMCKKNCSVRRRMSGDNKSQSSSNSGKRALSESKSKKGEVIAK